MEGFAIPTGIDGRGVAQFAAGNSYVEFFTGREVDSVASEKASRPIYRNADFVKVLHPGERDCAILLATEDHKRRWPNQWAAYQNGKQQVPEGTPMDVLLPNNPAMVENLKSLNFHTIEQMANASDTALQAVGMGCRELQEKAQKFLQTASGAAGFHKLQSEVEAKETRIKQLEDVVSRLEAKLSRLESDDGMRHPLDEPNVVPIKRGPGRPRKAE